MHMPPCDPVCGVDSSNYILGLVSSHCSQDHSTGPNIHSILKMQDLKRNFLYAINNAGTQNIYTAITECLALASITKMTIPCSLVYILWVGK